MLAVADARGGLALYAVARGDHVATLLRRLDGRRGMTVDSVSLSGGPSPAACAVWRSRPSASTDTTSDLVCYASGATRGRVIQSGETGTVGVRGDGRALAWTEYNSGDLVIADLAGDVVTVRRRMPYAESAPPGGYPEGLGEVDWIGPRTLVGTAVGDSDESVGLCVIDLDNPRPEQHVGFGRCVHPKGAEADRGYAHFEQAALVAPGEAVVVERAMGCCSDENPQPPARAVRLRLSDGAVLAVVATPRPGRGVIDVSGGARAVVYTTAVLDNGAKDLSVSLRWAWDAHGAPVTGLPADLTLAVAQP